ncbi:MAG: hypothetical protein M3Q72_05050, partial [Actinomycetota bacterium]|nr:hypothetical protein [Actinomycetota bacterium]
MIERIPAVGGAEIAAGILAAAGALHVDLTVDDIAARLVAVRDTSSFWRGGGSPAGSPVARFAAWRRPEPSVLTARLHRALAEGFVRTFPPASPPPVTFLRLEVGTLEEATVLSGARAQSVRVVPHLRIGTTGAQRPLRTPLRVGATGESGVDVVVVEAGDGRALGGVIAPVAVIVGAPSEGVVHRLNRMVALGYGGLALVEDRRADLVPRLGAALARGLPLDVALASSVAGDVVLVVDEAMLHSEPPVESTPSASPPSAAPAPTTRGPEPRSSRRFRWPWRPKDDAPGESESVRD